MIRPVAIIVAAIKLTQPGMSDSTAKGYATILHEEGKRRNFDPLTAVSMVRNESRWIANTVGGLNGACYGLGQKCAHVFKVCRDNGYKSDVCLAKMTPYLDGNTALRALARDITANRRVCREITGKPALFARWLSSYQGFNDHRKSGRKGVWCNMKKNRRGVWRDVRTPELTKKVMRYRRTLIRKLYSSNGIERRDRRSRVVLQHDQPLPDVVEVVGEPTFAIEPLRFREDAHGTVEIVPVQLGEFIFDAHLLRGGHYFTSASSPS